MLITSTRHRRADLALWRELEDADLSVAVPETLISETTEAIQAWSSGGRCYAGTSWGKDSVVMLHLFIMSGVSLPTVYMRLRGHCDNPDCDLVRDIFLSRFSLDYHERWFAPEECRNGEHWRAIQDEFGDRRATGLRSDESTNRRMSIACLGLDTGRSFRPLGHWRLKYVFAYLAQQSLPVHPAYACLGGGRWPRERLRTHSIGGERGTEFGRREWEQEYYPEALRRIEAK
jgi:phosphoadenosine phosphosulfate reductase